jgi:hypothetical protein
MNAWTTPDAEFYRVVRHETGHTLGFPHEHMRKEIIVVLRGLACRHRGSEEREVPRGAGNHSRRIFHTSIEGWACLRTYAGRKEAHPPTERLG